MLDYGLHFYCNRYYTKNRWMLQKYDILKIPEKATRTRVKTRYFSVRDPRNITLNVNVMNEKQYINI